jgi:hypothetical protein
MATWSDTFLPQQPNPGAGALPEPPVASGGWSGGFGNFGGMANQSPAFPTEFPAPPVGNGTTSNQQTQHPYLQMMGQSAGGNTPHNNDPRLQLGRSNPDGSYGGGMPQPPQRGGMGQSPWGKMPPVRPPNQSQNGAVNARWQPQRYGQGTQFGGQNTTGAQAGAADYQGVQGFADQAYEQARRRIDPMQEQAGRRMEQELINKGIDPSSAQGMAMLDQQNRNFADQDNSATFGALQFGQGIQDQMFNQSFANTKQAGDMQQGMWGNERNNQNIYGQKYGDELRANVGFGANDVNRYGMDQRYNLGLGDLELGRQRQDFNETLGYDNIDYRNNLFNQNQQNWKDTFSANLMGANMSPYGGGAGQNFQPGSGVEPYGDWWTNYIG